MARLAFGGGAVFVLCFFSATAAQTSMFGEEVNICALSTPGDVTTSGIKFLQPHVTPSYYDTRTGTRSNIECFIECKKDYPTCISAYYDDDTGICYLLSESIHSMYDRSNQVFTSSSTDPTGRRNRQIMTINQEVLNVGREDSSAQCSATSCAAGSHTCRTDCTNTESVCVAKFSECDQTPVSNIRHWYWNDYHYGSDTGAAHTVTYKKQYSYTGLRVQYRGTIRAAYNCAGCCTRWHYTFNDVECQHPGTIEIVWYWGNSVDFHRPGQVDGICEGLPAGDIVVKLIVGGCSGYSAVDSVTGWGSSIGSSISIEENDLRHSFETDVQTYEGNAGGAACVFPFVYNGQSYSQCTDINHNQLWCATTSSYDVDALWGHCPGTCPGLSRFNIKQYSWTGTNGDDNAHLYTFYYYKRAADTAIYVQLITNMYISGVGALRYYIRFNDNDCSDPGHIDGVIAHMDGSMTQSQHDGSSSVTGLCDNIGSGRIKITVHIQQTSSSPNGETGWNSRSRFLVEEVRYDTDISAVVTTDGTIQRLPEFNIHQWLWSSLNDDTDVGPISSISVTYVKKSSLSQLKVWYHGDLRQREVSQARGVGCNRWYFTFNGNECSDPGPVSTLIYQYVFYTTEEVYDNQHHVSTLEGYCNLPAGSYNIKLHVMTCNGYTYNEAYTCWSSSCRVVAQEVFLAGW